MEVKEEGFPLFWLVGHVCVCGLGFRLSKYWGSLLFKYIRERVAEVLDRLVKKYCNHEGL